MSSSQRPSNNNNSTYPNQLLDYETNDTLSAPRSSQHPMPEQPFSSRNQPVDNGVFQQMYSYQGDMDENLPSEIVAELDARDRLQANFNDEDDSVFSDAVQDAFKKYQNEYSRYWTYNDTIWDNKFSEEELPDEEQEELYAQMEECWNYMSQEDEVADTSKPSMEPIQESALNPDANEFKPFWLKPFTPASSDEPSVNSTSSSQLEAQGKPF